MATAAARRSPGGETNRPVESKPGNTDLDPSIQSIIDKGRAVEPGHASARGTWVLPGLTTGLLWACFTPLNFSPLAWIALVPLCLLIRSVNRTRRMYRMVYAAGFVWGLITLQWMRLGHPSMYVALIALSAYVAFYFPAFVGLSRVAVHRFKVPVLFAVPVVWTGLEFARAHLLTGFSWYYLGHSQYRWVELIQVSDLVGSYGVSFIVALANAALVMMVPLSFFQKMGLVTGDSGEQQIVSSKRPWLIAATCVGVLAGALTYGYARRGAADFRKGPRVALIQGNFTSEVKHDPSKAEEIAGAHDWLTYAAMKHGANSPEPPQRPELIVWPETMFPWPNFEAQAGMTDEEILRLIPRGARIPHEQWLRMFRGDDSMKRLENDARTYDAAMLMGISSIKATPEGQEQRNSVAFVTPQLGFQGRYDKRHLVMFGEYVPLKKQIPILAMFTPYGSDFGLEAGTEAKVFEYAGSSFSPLICFEDTVPHLVRSLVNGADQAGKPLDFLVNNTNDGWFHGSSELDQHLITAAFRCVETRTTMVRAVNTGVSAFIDGDGVIREPDVFLDGESKKREFLDEGGNWTKSLPAALVDNVPLDNRTSLYVKTGDVFAGSCGLACFLLMGAGFFNRRKEPTSDVDAG